MRLGLDARMIRHSGIGTSIRGLLDHWSGERLKQVTLFTPPGWENPYPCEARVAPERVYGAAQHLFYGRRLNGEKLDLYHMPHFDVPLGYRGPYVATIHDLIHILFPEHSTKPFSRAYARFQVGRVVRNARRIIAVSENTRNDLARLFPGSEAKVTVLYPAASADFRPLAPLEAAPVLGKHRLTPGYILYVGNLRGSKNTPRLVHAYVRARAASTDFPPLVLAGQNSCPEFDRGFPEGVRHLGPVDGGDLPSLYNGASIFAFPSLYEGFGLPPLEAMASGTPVVTSGVASLPEVCGNAAVYVDPYSETSIAAGLRDLWLSPSRRDDLRRRGLERAARFNWTNFAEGTWRVYEEALGGGS